MTNKHLICLITVCVFILALTYITCRHSEKMKSLEIELATVGTQNHIPEQTESTKLAKTSKKLW